MNSYPVEFLTQLGPVMFIAGLDGSPAQPDDTETSEDDRILGKRLQADPFILLVKRLRDVLLEKSIKKGTVWVGDGDRTGPAFRTILVDKNVRFPPQKAGGQDTHSPLSPLTQTSPLYPDGLIAPIWVRKHIELLPAVFVFFLRLHEFSGRPPTTPMSPLHGQVMNEQEDERRKEEEKRRDTEMSAEIAARKRACSERGIKLTVVLMASRRMLDDPTLDSRLTYIRRQSALDSRAALFVLSPVSPSELQDFVKSLQSALHDATLDYYLNHSKRVRRKRTRHAGNIGPGTSMYGNAAGQVITPSAYTPRTSVQPLRPQGWLARYEYKMACFAEFRGEEEVARKHFQTSWEILLDMFGSTAVLPPRTKRWAEAKVLADCISVKIIKLYLYRAEHSRALAHFNVHLARFTDFSRGWGIGEETWEFWSWVARWYRLLAELLDMATLSTLTLPTYLPTYPIQLPTSPTLGQHPPQNPSIEPPRPAGINPSNALQHPGFYYYAAAMCTERRLERFIMANEEAGAGPANLTNERKVDHRIIILELYTKSYELFKKYSHDQRQSRLTLHIACRIAQTYRDSGKYDLAVRFFERIAKAYRRECWGTMLLPILSIWYGCAKELGDVDSSVRLLIEMLGCGPSDSFEQGQVESDLTAILKTTSPSTVPFKLDLSDSPPIIDLSVLFWRHEIGISEPAAFQLYLKAPTWASLAILPFVSLRLEFSDPRPPVVIKHRPSASDAPLALQLVDLGAIPPQAVNEGNHISANLRWAIGGTLILTGTLASESPTTLGISKVVLTAVESNWTIEITLDPESSRILRPSRPRWLSCLDPPFFLPIVRNNTSTALVRHRPHLIDAIFSHARPAYLDEDYPIIISVTNADDYDINVVVDILLQPPEDEAVNTITLDTDCSSGLIKGVQYGILVPGETIKKTLVLNSTGVPGDRIIDVSIQCEEPGTKLDEITKEEKSPTVHQFATNTSETLHTLSIPTVAAFETKSLVTYRRLSTSLGLADPRTYDPSFMETQAESFIRTTFLCRGPWDVLVEKMVFIPMENDRVKLMNCSLNGEEDIFPLYCNKGDVYSVTIHFVLYVNDVDVDCSNAIPGPGEYQITWSRVDSSGTRLGSAVTRTSLPALSPPSDSINALLDLPTIGRLHEPSTVTLIIRNKHAWRTADLHLQLETSDHFVVSGLRSGNLPVMLAGSEEHVTFNLIPISCGTVQLPTFKLVDRRKTPLKSEGGETTELDDKVDIIDARLEESNEDGEQVRLMSVSEGEGGVRRLRPVDAEGLSMFVLPS